MYPRRYRCVIVCLAVGCLVMGLAHAGSRPCADPEQRTTSSAGASASASLVARGLGPDRTGAGPVEVGGSHTTHFEYRDTFAEPWYREDATIDGASQVHWDEASSTLELRGSPRRRVRLCYHIVSPFVMKDIAAEIAGAIRGVPSDRLELALSPDGRAFGHAVRAFASPKANAFLLTTNASDRFHGRGFWVRITGELGPSSHVRLESFRVAGRVKPPLRCQVALEPDGSDCLRYRDDFRSAKFLHLAEISEPHALEWRRGRFVLARGANGPARVAVRQKFTAGEPLRSIVIRIDHAADRRPGRDGSRFGLSLDGHTLLACKATPGPDGAFRGTTELRIDDPARLANAREFYLHMVLASTISCVEVEAHAAKPREGTIARVE